MSADLAHRLVEAINERDYSAIEELCSAAVQLRLPPGRVFYGRDGIRDFFHELERLIPDLTFTARKVWRGMGFVIVEWDTAGTTNQGRSEALGVLVVELDGEERAERVQLYLDTAQWESIHDQPE